ncbi:MAG TPA: ABC transporter substrate-binding protein [Methanothrix sp.]|uniref:ABC transporter substrate-binding protein n=1 Tax=Methanothrix sp. TaxID=90426 RepID=UPI002BF5DF96|nr:ABC transporter substrate-binding protein [Methanothrix sp.]MDI9417567.1 ABC transporter substrate-binding protein [Euryarchaeota archaeon]HON35424.1 ABC transporter substrate-binding protein [Methanothrix sp.]HRU75876.1 ABC transporter substrate-binding protein [Methanothrix sp.]
MSSAALASYPKTFTDTQGREITLDEAPQRIITRAPDEARVVIALGYGDKLIAGEQATKSCLCPMTFDNVAEGCLNCYETIIDGRMPDLPEISTRYDIYFEEIAKLKPDLIFCGNLKDAEAFEDKIGCPVVVLGGSGWNFGEDGYYDSIRVAAEALDAQEKAEELISFALNKVEMIESVTKNVDPEKKPKVYFASRGAGTGFYDPKEGRDFTRTEPNYDPLVMAGGRNVASEIEGNTVNVPLEQIIAWNPDYIFISNSAAGNNTGLEFIKNSPELASINAIKEGNVYNCFYPHCRGQPPDRNLLNMMYMAKIMYPEEFKDLDLEKEGNEIFKAFLGVDGVFTEYADYMVWPREYLDSLK